MFHLHIFKVLKGDRDFSTTLLHNNGLVFYYQRWTKDAGIIEQKGENQCGYKHIRKNGVGAELINEDEHKSKVRDKSCNSSAQIELG